MTTIRVYFSNGVVVALEVFPEDAILDGAEAREYFWSRPNRVFLGCFHDPEVAEAPYAAYLLP